MLLIRANSVELDENGAAEVTIQLTEAEARMNQDSTFYYVHGSSVFDIVVTDPASNPSHENSQWSSTLRPHLQV